MKPELFAMLSPETQELIRKAEVGWDAMVERLKAAGYTIKLPKDEYSYHSIHAPDGEWIAEDWREDDLWLEAWEHYKYAVLKELVTAWLTSTQLGYELAGKYRDVLFEMGMPIKPPKK